jgi:hypothetical protein
MTTPVRHKQRNYELWTTGAFGNRLRAWQNPDEYHRSGFPGRVVLRYLGGSVGGQWCRYNLMPDVVDEVIAELVAEGAEYNKIMVNEAAPDSHVIFNGELWTGADPVDALLYSTVRAHMRPALAAEQRKAHGLASRMILRSLMTPSSYEDLQVLVEQYDNHAIELSIFSICVGDIPGRNALVWEVRQY